MGRLQDGGSTQFHFLIVTHPHSDANTLHKHITCMRQLYATAARTLSKCVIRSLSVYQMTAGCRASGGEEEPPVVGGSGGGRKRLSCCVILSFPDMCVAA